MGIVKKGMDENIPKKGTRLSLVIYNFETCYVKVSWHFSYVPVVVMLEKRFPWRQSLPKIEFKGTYRLNEGKLENGDTVFLFFLV